MPARTHVLRRVSRSWLPTAPSQEGPGDAKGSALSPTLLQVPRGAFTDTRHNFKAREAAHVMAEKCLDGEAGEVGATPGPLCHLSGNDA